MSTPTLSRTPAGDESAAAPPATVVVSGVGVAAPNGLGTQRFWSAVTAGENGIGPITRFDASSYPARLAGEVPGFDAAALLPSRLLPQTDHMTQLALVVADEALADARFTVDADGDLDVGVVTASSAGGFEFGQKELQALWRDGSRYVSAYQSFAWFYAVNSGQISIRHGLRGHSGVLVTEQAGGIDAIGQARRQLRKGAARMIVAGGVDGAICPWGLTAMLTGGRLSTGTDPATAYRPFAADAAGHVPAEGGALLVLEDAAACRARGARPYATVAGYASIFDSPVPGRTPGLERAIRVALADASCAPGDVDVVFADAAGTRELDPAEAAALRAVFGPRGVPVTAPKARLGRLSAGGASLDVACALLALRDGVVPPTVGIEPAADLELDLLDRPLPRRPETVLVLARGQGGFNSALVLTRAL